MHFFVSVGEKTLRRSEVNDGEQSMSEEASPRHPSRQGLGMFSYTSLEESLSLGDSMSETISG